MPAKDMTLEEAQDAYEKAVGYLGYAQATNDVFLIREAQEQLKDVEEQKEKAEKAEEKEGEKK